MAYTFGPVPSRRLGRSLGVNNIPPKYCTYACVYCQLGDPQHVTVERRSFYDPGTIVAETVSALERSRGSDREGIDYVTIVPDGEPTLDARFGDLVAGLRREIDRFNGGTGDQGAGAGTVGAGGRDERSGSGTAPVPGKEIPPVRLAVITNGSLITEPDVWEALHLADWVSLKVDAPDEQLWRKIDRPARALAFEPLIERFTAFAGEFSGTCATETMLVDTLNTVGEVPDQLARRIAAIAPDLAYLSIPTRPPAEAWAMPPDEATVTAIYRTFSDAGIPVELNVTHEEGEFIAAGEVGESILAITSVHPIREDDLRRTLEARGADWHVVEELLESETLLRQRYRNENYYIARLKPRRPLR